MPRYATSKTATNDYVLLLRPGFRLSDLVRMMEWMTARKLLGCSPINWSLCSMEGGLVRDHDGMLLMAPDVLQRCLGDDSLLLVLSGKNDDSSELELHTLLEQRRNQPLLWVGPNHLFSDYYLLHELASRQSLDEVMIRLFMSDLTVEQGDRLLQGLEVAPTAMGPCDTRVQRALAVMRRDIDQPLNRDRISREACLSVRQLERLFQKHFELTPGKYFTQMKMDFARYCLQNSGQNITDVAYRLGFNSVSHFGKTYKSRFGVAPGRTPLFNGACKPVEPFCRS